jgi:hypothetical protein
MFRILVYKSLNVIIGKPIRVLKTMLHENQPNDIINFYQALNEISMKDSAAYAYEHFNYAIPFKTKEKFWDFCIDKCKILEKNNNKIIVECGVWKGYSINYFARKLPNTPIYGFDSFMGLKEDWHGYGPTSGYFSTGGVMPKVRSNVTLIKGWFNDTLPIFYKENKSKQIGILHLDADTYNSTKLALVHSLKNVIKGTIIIFDEFYGYPNWRSHEFKAWSEFSKKNKIKFKYIAYTNRQVAIQVL